MNTIGRVSYMASPVHQRRAEVYGGRRRVIVSGGSLVAVAVRPSDRSGPRLPPVTETRTVGLRPVGATPTARRTRPACQPPSQIRAIYRLTFAHLLVSRLGRRFRRTILRAAWRAPGASLSP
ncbi:unnamed protein product [Macrosiphum euphorbiae]|uniref:Uncharacterized protein n=1 Tax=Macrosiphum euphorbiae TaxID=13131 RepID=A0AAV0W2Q3_9HEMI|nr:unnamed protein product [Macrosiphum euphorbiae]